jgi:NADH:ubiquinone oxidoreductase subunit F (NADH-binding)
MESCIGHFKDEYLDQIQEAKNFKELRKIIGKCVRDWNVKRIHSALKGRSPDEFIQTLSLKLKKRPKSVQE